jgi:hypothetical protein
MKTQPQGYNFPCIVYNDPLEDHQQRSRGAFFLSHHYKTHLRELVLSSITLIHGDYSYAGKMGYSFLRRGCDWKNCHVAGNGWHDNN